MGGPALVPGSKKCPYARRAKDRGPRQTFPVVAGTRPEPNAADGHFLLPGSDEAFGQGADGPLQVVAELGGDLVPDRLHPAPLHGVAKVVQGVKLPQAAA